ncbi:asparagine synthase [Gorgonomyces haynaldii]|nr:asparagine synthase [Gorgonomyces haynaldii]
MCGIFAVFNAQNPTAFRARATQLSKKIRHRGPDWSGLVIKDNHVLCHERLAIVGIDSGAQPLTSEDGQIVLCVNGEIYNHVSLRKKLKREYKFKTHSDCEVLIYLWLEMGKDMVNVLDGMYSFVLYDARTKEFFACRDHVGITTLYQGLNKDGSVWFASEMKALNEECERIIAFPPGHYYSSVTKDWTQYYKPGWFDAPPNEQQLSQSELDKMYLDLRAALENSVKKRLMSDVPYGVLLSGGLDSSLIASIAVRQRRTEQDLTCEDDDIRSAFSSVQAWPKLHSFSIGLPGSPDLEAAKKVADFLGTKHHAFTFTVQEGIDAIFDVIYHLETYDVTTIRASTPMYLLSRKIKAMGVKMVLSGEGSDEIFGGYLYFYAAPDARALHTETISRIQNLHYSDNLRANKSTMAWGLEARVPFLDKQFLEVAMKVPPATKMHRQPPYNFKMEKYILRKAFDNPEDPYLPDEVLWRQKEQFSDGVGYSWIDTLKEHAIAQVSDEQFAKASERWSKDTPTTKEAYWYRELFEQHFPQEQCLESVVRWIPRKDWGCNEDPSGRAQKVHNQAY